MDSKYFNNTTSTSTGRPKFLPPQKRQVLESTGTVLPQQAVQVEKKIEKVVHEIKPLPQPKLIEEQPKHQEMKVKNNLFYRNSSSYLTIWGSRHLRNGMLDPNEERDDKKLFDEHCKLIGLVEHKVENYDDLDIDIQNKYNLQIPQPNDKFEQLNLSPFLLANIKRCMYEKCTIVQRHSIPIIMNKLNIMAASQTGSGKTASFLIPIINNLLKDGPPPMEIDMEKYKMEKKVYPVCLILAPTRELALQTYNESRKFCSKLGVISKVIYGGKDYGMQRRYLSYDGCDVLIATPGRLIDSLDHYDISFQSLRYVVIDEADRMLDMGFEIQIKRILKEALDDNPQRKSIQVSMFSATFPKEIRSFAETYLGAYVHIAFGSQGGKTGSVNKCIKQELIDVRGTPKNQILFDLMKSLEGKLLIFCDTKKCVQAVFTYLSAKNFFVTAIHGDKSQDERERELGLFKTKCSIMVATDVASRGLDIPNVTYVINYDLPSNVEDYIHRIGRTGRVGRLGTSVSFVDVCDKPVLGKLHKLLKESGQVVPKWFDEMTENLYEEKQMKFYQKYQGNFGNGQQGYGRKGKKPVYKGGGKQFGGGPNFNANANFAEEYEEDGYDEYYADYQ